MPSIRKLRAGRVTTVSSTDYVGEYGSIFWDEALGTLRLSDGVTPGGRRIVLQAEDINLAFGHFVADVNNLSTVNANEDLNLISNGTGSINLVGEIDVFPTSQGVLGTPIFEIGADGKIKIRVSDIDPTLGAVEIIGNQTGASLPPMVTGTMLHVTGQPGLFSRIYNDGVGGNAAFVGRRYNGTTAAPTAIKSGESALRLTAVGYSATGMPVTGFARISYDAIEDFTDSAQGGQIKIYTNPAGSTVMSVVATIDNQDGIKAVKFSGPLVTPAGTGNTPPIKLTPGGLLTASMAGAVEYSPQGFFSTVFDGQRGIIPSQQFYSLSTVRTFTPGNNLPQSILGVGVMLSPNTKYWFRIKTFISRSSGGNNQTMAMSWGGTATLARITYTATTAAAEVGAMGAANIIDISLTSAYTAPVTVTPPANVATPYSLLITGIVEVSGGGTLDPQVGWSIDPGTVSVFPPSMMMIYPIGVSGTETNIGDWR